MTEKYEQHSDLIWYFRNSFYFYVDEFGEYFPGRFYAFTHFSMVFDS